jgi:predicted signal transduction protein with EAL and GGDEF domain
MGRELNKIERYFFSTNATEATKQSMKPLKNPVLIYRWVIAVLIILISAQYADVHRYGIFYCLLVFVFAAYNLIVTRLTLRQWAKYSIANIPLMFLNVLFIAAFTMSAGGVASDLYIILLIHMGSCILLRDAGLSFKFGIFSTVMYVLACIMYSYIFSTDYEMIKLTIRAIVLLIWTYIISLMNKEISKFEEACNNEFKLARTDNLTGLANRLYFDQRLNVEKEYAERNNSVVNVLMFDLDDFKGFNDTYGHLAGDKLLKLFADIMRRCIRKYDIPMRYGGEEFFLFIMKSPL